MLRCRVGRPVVTVFTVGFTYVLFLSHLGHDLLRYNNNCLSTANTNKDRFMDYL